MAIYFLFCAFTLILYFFCSKIKIKSLRVTDGVKAEALSDTQTQPLFVFIVFFALIAIFALRHPSMGIDLDVYLPSYEQIGKKNLEWFFTDGKFYNFEIGYVFLNKILYSISKSTQFLLVVCAVLSLAPIGFFIAKHSKNALVSVIVYFGIPIFLISFSALRQAIAVGIIAIALHFVKKRRFWLFVAIVLLASLFHSSAIVFLIAYPVYYFKHGKMFSFISMLAFPVIWLLKEPLLLLLIKIANKNVSFDNNGAITLFLVFVCIYGFCVFFGDEKNTTTSGMLNLFWFACAIQAMGGLYSTALRLGYYFILPLVILLPEVFSDMQKKEKSVAQAVQALIIVVFLVYGLYAIYTSTWPEAYPYSFFWQN